MTRRDSLSIGLPLYPELLRYLAVGLADGVALMRGLKTQGPA
ncbi:MULTISPECIES: hypothetical protein [unclassified Sphingobium]|nr:MULTISPECIES: hypothetical protein [unclassified Sphingobium]MCW2350742.1 hypothetical protein [Sphingobium sp. B12D2B]MCW2369845.1 hypothetical protein [Sphingobium sp. B11D3D]